MPESPCFGALEARCLNLRMVSSACLTAASSDATLCTSCSCLSWLTRKSWLYAMVLLRFAAPYTPCCTLHTLPGLADHQDGKRSGCLHPPDVSSVSMRVCPAALDGRAGDTPCGGYSAPPRAVRGLSFQIPIVSHDGVDENVCEAKAQLLAHKLLSLLVVLPLLLNGMSSLLRPQAPSLRRQAAWGRQVYFFQHGGPAHTLSGM